MQAVDTNVLVRILVDDPKASQQVKQARYSAKKAGSLFIPQIVQVELVWVLDSAYGIAKNEIISILKHLQENEAFLLQHEDQYNVALQQYQTTHTDFSDCLIYAESQAAGYEIITFDKKFSRLPHVTLLE